LSLTSTGGKSAGRRERDTGKGRKICRKGGWQGGAHTVTQQQSMFIFKISNLPKRKKVKCDDLIFQVGQNDSKPSTISSSLTRDLASSHSQVSCYCDTLLHNATMSAKQAYAL